MELNLTATNKKTIYLVYDAKKYKENDSVCVILETESLYECKKLCNKNKDMEYSSYEPFCYAPNK